MKKYQTVVALSLFLASISCYVRADDCVLVSTDKCKTGDYFFENNTCSSTYCYKKQPIGFVVDAEKHLVADVEVSREVLDMPSVQVDGLKRILSSAGKSNWRNYAKDNVWTDDDGKSNSEKILAYGKEKNVSFPAVEYCANLKKGNKKWFLPAIGQLEIFRKNVDLKKILELCDMEWIMDENINPYWRKQAKEDPNYDGPTGDMLKNPGNVNLEDQCDYYQNSWPMAAGYSISSSQNTNNYWLVHTGGESYANDGATYRPAYNSDTRARCMFTY